ncbi:MAG: MBOAT family protein [Planctomycetota bacterium]|nr:MBOAT family protein [Planctomycetota bacterium]
MLSLGDSHDSPRWFLAVVFSSHLFVFYFLPLALLLYYAAPQRSRHVLLTALSYLFYGWANPLFVVLMGFSTAVDYFCGRVISGEPTDEVRGSVRSRRQKVALAVSILTNLSLLGFFKYFNFGVDSFNALATSLGAPGWQWETFFRITLPLGISFYTFQSMSYTIDVYRGQAASIRNPIDFACYVSMFPQLVAGPIIRFHEVARQLEHREHSLEKIARGTALFSLGLAKKVLLANSCGLLADIVFNAGSRDFLDAWLGLLAYSFQIYFDFSGYSDMAIGLGLMLGFTFPKNFDSPYRSASITEFWQRWHLSLSNWLRDYLYIPLGGNRRGPSRTYVNLAMVMLLGGLWHGAAWTFVAWGALHGVALAVERALGKQSLYHRLPRPVRVTITFLVVAIGWVFFRSNSLSDAGEFLGSLAGITTPVPGNSLLSGMTHQPWLLGWLIVAAVVTWTAPQSWDWTRRITIPRAVVLVGLFWISLLLLTTQSFNPFIYFIF